MHWTLHLIFTQILVIACVHRVSVYICCRMNNAIHFFWHCIWPRPKWFVQFNYLCINVLVFVSALFRVSSWMLRSPFNVIQALKDLMIILKHVQIKMIVEQFKLPFSFCPSKGKAQHPLMSVIFLFAHGESEKFYVSLYFQIYQLRKQGRHTVYVMLWILDCVYQDRTALSYSQPSLITYCLYIIMVRVS